MNTMTDEDRTRALRVLARRQRIRSSPLRRALRHPLRLGYPMPSRLRKWKQSGYSVQTKAPTPWGQRIIVTLPDDVSVFLRRNGFFEYELSAFYLRFLKQGMTFVDIGAHVGYFSMLASSAVGPTGRVLACEPTPRLSGPRPILSIEVGDMGVPDAPASREVVEKVLSFDYRAFEMRDSRVIPHQVREQYGYENILFAPSERAHVMMGMF